MDDWVGEVLNPEDRQEAMENFSPDEIDAEFLPHLTKINTLPFVASIQCCIGHLSYDKWLGPVEDLPEGHSACWGYLHLMATYEAAEWLSQEADWDWLWIPGSQLLIEGAGSPDTTKNGSLMIAFAWDSAEWPQPALDIVEALDRFFEKYRDD